MNVTINRSYVNEFKLKRMDSKEWGVVFQLKESSGHHYDIIKSSDFIKGQKDRIEFNIKTGSNLVIKSHSHPGEDDTPPSSSDYIYYIRSLMYGYSAMDLVFSKHIWAYRCSGEFIAANYDLYWRSRDNELELFETQLEMRISALNEAYMKKELSTKDYIDSMAQYGIIMKAFNYTDSDLNIDL